jgi:putative DNA primase/helicase
MRDVDGALHSLQHIAPDGAKQFLKGGRKKGCFFVIGELNSSMCGLAEGFATAASFHEAIGYAVVVAFDAGNLLSVMQALRAKYPFAAITIAADDDISVEGNPGLTKAKEAAAAIGASLAVPDFGTNRPVDAREIDTSRDARIARRGTGQSFLLWGRFDALVWCWREAQSAKPAARRYPA